MSIEMDKLWLMKFDTSLSPGLRNLAAWAFEHIEVLETKNKKLEERCLNLVRRSQTAAEQGTYG